MASKSVGHSSEWSPFRQVAEALNSMFGRQQKQAAYDPYQAAVINLAVEEMDRDQVRWW